MKSPHGKGVYKHRATGRTDQCPLAQLGPHQFNVRGRQKVRAVLTWFALANNILAGHRLKTNNA